MTGVKIPVERNPELVRLTREEELWGPCVQDDKKERSSSDSLQEGVALEEKLGGDYYYE